MTFSLLAMMSTPAQAVNQYRSNGTGGGTWSSTATWQLSTDGGATWGAAGATPTSADDTIEIRSGDTVNTITTVSADQITVDAGGILSLANALSVTNGAAGTDLDVFGTVTITGQTSALTLLASATVVVENGGVISHAGSSGGCVLAVTGSSITFANGGKFSLVRSGGTVPTSTWNPGSTCEINGSQSSAPGGFSGQSFANFTWNPSAQSTDLDLDGNLLTVNGNLRIQSTGSFALKLSLGTNQTFTVGGDLTVDSGTILTVQSSSGSSGNAMNIGGNVSINGTFQATAGSPVTINFNKSGAQSFTLTGTIGDKTRFAYHVNSGSTLTLNNDVAVDSGANLGSFSVDSGGTLNCVTQVISGTGAFTLSSGGTLGIGSVTGINGNITTTTETFDTAGNYIYNGTAAQGTGSLLPAAVNDLVITNSAGVTLGSAVTINGKLELTNGVFTTTSANTPAVSSGGSITGGADVNSYVSGPLARTYSATGSKTFPIGKNSNFRPLTLNYTALTGASTVTAEQNDPGTFPGSFTAVTPFSARYWTVTESGSSARTYNITLDGTGFSPAFTAVILKYNSPTTTKFSTTFSSPNYTASGLTSFSDFDLGDDACMAPTATVSGDTNICGGSSATIQAALTGAGPWDLTWLDGAGGTNFTQNGVASSPATRIVTPSSTTNYTVTAVSDSTACAGAGSGSATVTVNVTPTAVCLSDITVSAAPGQCSSNIDFSVTTTGSPAPTVECKIGVTVITSPHSFLVGTNTVNCTASNDCGVANCSFAVIVNDTQAPSIAGPAPVTVNADLGQCSATNVVLGTPLSTNDNCAVSTVVNNGSEPYAVGTNDVVWTVTDIHGNQSICTQQVIVVDNQAPSITCPLPVTTNADPGQCSATGVVLGTATASDNCGAFVTSNAPSSFPVGTNYVAWTATDASGNSATCTQQVTVVDNQPPVIICTDVTVSIPNEQSCACGPALGNPVVNDNCGVASVTNNAPSCFPVGTNLVAWTATDIHGNSANCTQQVVVVQVTVDSSNFKITGIEAIGDDINLIWQTFGNSTNVIQLVTPIINGNFTNSYLDIDTVIVPGSGLVITNWVDYGGATNFPSRYYRIRLQLGACPP